MDIIGSIGGREEKNREARIILKVKSGFSSRFITLTGIYIGVQFMSIERTTNKHINCVLGANFFTMFPSPEMAKRECRKVLHRASLLIHTVPI